MAVPCVRVERDRGEAVRQRLAADDLVSNEWDLDADDGWVYIPVSAPERVPTEFEVVPYEAPKKETQSMPADRLGFEPTYERLGDIVILDEDDEDRAREIAEAIMTSAIPAKTIVNRASPVSGERRLREWTVVAGNGTETVHREYGCEFNVDIVQVYFSPRLATERHRVVEQVGAGEHVFDMFCGVGPFAIPCAKRGATVVGTDVNEVAIDYLRENAARNDVEAAVTGICGDVRDVAKDYSEWADRVIMNLPHRADEFLDVALQLAGGDCIVHYYDIQHEDDPFGPGESAIRAAAESAYDVDVLTRREVRSYAPHELNVCLDVRLTRTR